MAKGCMASKHARRPIIEFSFDDGTIYDLVAVELLLDFGFTGTFYIPTTAQLPMDAIRKMSEQGMRIGGHTASHPEDMKQLSDERQFREIYENKKWLEHVIGKKVSTFAYPSGRFNPMTIKMAKKAGMTSARKTGWGNTKKPTDKFRICPTVFISPDKSKFDGMPWYVFAEKKFCEQGAQYHHVWGHAQDLERFEMWREFETYLYLLSQKKI